MRTIEVTGNTVDEAIANALAEINLPLESVIVQILDKGARGSDEEEERLAKIRVSEKPSPENGIKAKDFLKTLLSLMGIQCEVTYKIHGNSILLEVWNVPDGGILIGYRGVTLNALQCLVNQFMNKNWKPGEERVDVEVDTQEYRQRRKRMLSRMVNDAIAKIESTGKSVELEPMFDVDRKFVHILIRDRKGITSVSEGEGESRHIILSKENQEVAAE
jgi:spoIIIJ-associated protein